MHTWNVVYFILLLLGSLCFLVSFLRGTDHVAGTRTYHLVALGLLFWIVVPLIKTVKGL